MININQNFLFIKCIILEIDVILILYLLKNDYWEICKKNLFLLWKSF